MKVGTQRAVEFKCEHQRVAGTLHMPLGGGRRPAVLLCHGFTGNRMEAHFLFVKMSKELQRREIASLRFDFRGSGESDGEFRDMTVLTEIADAKRALSFLTRVKGIDGDRVGVLGFSLGGFVAASISTERKVKSLVLWSAVAHLQDLMAAKLAARMEALTGRPVGKKGTGRDMESLLVHLPSAVDMGGHLVGKGFFEAADKENSIECLARCKAPVLIMHGDSDESVPVQHSRDSHHTALNRGIESVLKMVPGGDHTFADVQIEQKVIAETAGWFEGTL